VYDPAPLPKARVEDVWFHYDSPSLTCSLPIILRNYQFSNQMYYLLKETLCSAGRDPTMVLERCTKWRIPTGRKHNLHKEWRDVWNTDLDEAIHVVCDELGAEANTLDEEFAQEDLGVEDM
jgi:hypothetical protein